MHKKLKPIRVLAASAVVMICWGCSLMNDNPTDANKMHEIRQKQAAERAQFNPSMTPPPRK
jgi:hypothetical protein